MSNIMKQGWWSDNLFNNIPAVVGLTLEVTTGPNSARAISADCAHGRNSAQFGMML